MSDGTTISGPNPVFEDSELVLGLVAPVGTNFNKFQNLLGRCLEKFRYAMSPVRLSELTRKFRVEPRTDEPSRTEGAKRLHEMMHAGNYLRHAAERGEFLALAAAAEIRGRREGGRAMLKTAHVLRSLKHPDEVRALRRIYGSGFYLIGITVAEPERRSYLRDEVGCTETEVAELLGRDEHEEEARYLGESGDNFGQRTRDTFQLADVFIPLADEKQLERFLELVFAAPHLTPTADEHAMFLAFTAALRSGDLSRQVGAVVVTADGDVAAVGANDVPRAGGGAYWPGPGDERDFARGGDANERQRDRIIADVLERLRPEGADPETWRQDGRQRLSGSPVMDITEYARAVHAEMEALISCGRTGVSARDATLYSTTFPCHNCAKHIIAAGIKRVVYVEPYPKSQAMALFDDSIALGPAVSGRVAFEAFTGVGPRRFFDLFSMGLSSGTTVKRKQKGATISWTHAQAVVRVPLMPNSYLDREQLAEHELTVLTQEPEEET